MAVPKRFVAEYPERCIKLLKVLEPEARGRKLVGSFALMVASAIFLTPYERMNAAHPLNEKRGELKVYKAIRQLKKPRFVNAPFWSGGDAGKWRYSRVVLNHSEPNKWQDEGGKHPLDDDAANDVANRKANDVLRVLRNALAHGNIVYLNQLGRQQPGTTVYWLAFLSRYEESEEDQATSETYRLVVATEDTFLNFVKRWGKWVQTFPADDGLSPLPPEAEATETLK